MRMVVLPTCPSVHHVYAVPTRAIRGRRTPLGLELKMLVSQSGGCWELKPGAVEGQPVLLKQSHLFSPRQAAF